MGGYQPLKIEPMNGSLDMPGASCAHAVYVHPDNPLQRLTVAQLEAIFGHEHRRGAANVRTWGDLGLKGDWAHQPIRLYAHDIETDPGLHLSRKLNWDNFTEFTGDAATRESANVLERRIVHAVAHDRFGMSVGCGGFGGAEVKAVAIAEHERPPYVQATKATIVARTYPLARRTYAFLNVPPDKNMEPKMKEFMRYVLSREGQADVQRSGAYLPLSGNDASEQLRLLR